MLNSQQRKRSDAREQGKLAAKQIMAVVGTALKEMPDDSARRGLLAKLRRLVSREIARFLDENEISRRANEAAKDRAKAAQ